jgi:nucleobase:cation symporter-1, NCS1 family
VIDFLFTNGNILVPWLFNPTSSNAHYRYHGGWNIQALIAYVVGIALPFPGFAASLGAGGVNQSGEELFYIGWLLSFFTSFVVYSGICYFWPTRNQRLIKEYKMGWEESENSELVGAGGSNASHASNPDEEAGIPQLVTETYANEKR